MGYLQIYVFPDAKTAEMIANKQNMVFGVSIVSSVVTSIISALIPVLLYALIKALVSKDSLTAKAPGVRLAAYYYVNCLVVLVLTLGFTYLTHNKVPAVANMAIYYGGVVIQILLSYSVVNKRKPYILFSALLLLVASITPVIQLITT
ncbi:hypothetical protein JCM14202_250 [Agrilactobacillus composti DSM 18527 = JCM 14202]|nr:hypothetical protein JCM14202_250 [Agrilactobacillus composti DSM 18527 = JCM 14202]